MARHTTIDSNDVIVTSDNGSDGTLGTGGLSGGTGGAGSNSLDVRAVAPAGAFLLGPSGTWTVQATSGDGGSGGAGGNASLLNGGDGGDGGDSGAATAILAGLTDSAFAASQMVVIDVSAASGNAGAGGMGGAAGTDLSALAGADGTDGSVGAASVIAHSLHFTGVTDLTLSLAASGGDGMGDSAGGDASATLSNAKFALVTTSTLLIEADATGGSGGDSGGANGSATVAMTSVSIRSSALPGTIEIVLNAVGGDNGVTPQGAGSIDFSGNSFVSTGGDMLSFSTLGDDSVATHDDLTIDMRRGTITLHDAGHGDSTSALHGFRQVFGGAGDDVIVGTKTSLIGGGAGADTLTAGGDDAVIYYDTASDSFGSAHDTITNMNFKGIALALPFAVAGTDKTVQDGDVSSATLDSDLATLLPGLQSHHAVLVSVAAGDLTGHLFLVIDANGTVGYQGNADMVIDVTGATHPNMMSTSNFEFYHI